MNHKQRMKNQVIGLDTSLHDIYKRISQFAPHDINILVTGETGTGKESMARLVHDLGPRSTGPFISVNCASIPVELFESELFGHEKGAFTGAGQMKRGLIEQAEGGTLFLDEIGDLPLSLQPKLLRILNDKCFYRVGSVKEIRTDFRLVSATNIDLPEAIEKNRFREDLFYRISTVSVCLPSLRQRPGDMEALVNHLIWKNAQQMQISPLPVEPRVLSLLKNFPWPGNIRQLEQVLLQALVLGQDQACITASICRDIISNKQKKSNIKEFNTAAGRQFDADPGDENALKSALKQMSDCVLEKRIYLKEIETEIIFFVLEKFNYNIQTTARKLGISIDKLYRTVKNRKLIHLKEKITNYSYSNKQIRLVK